MANYAKNVKCIYSNCGRTPWSNPELSFFAFPHKSRPTSEEKERFSHWVKRCGSEEAKCLEIDDTGDSTKRICSLHFHVDDMYSIGRCRSLLRHALPRDCRGVYPAYCDLKLVDSGEKPGAKSQDSIEFVDTSLPCTAVKSESPSTSTVEGQSPDDEPRETDTNHADDHVVVDSAAGLEVESSSMTSHTVVKQKQPSFTLCAKPRLGRRPKNIAEDKQHGVPKDISGFCELSSELKTQRRGKRPKNISDDEQPASSKDITGFCGFSSLKTESNLAEFCGISAKAFQLLLSLLPAKNLKPNLSREDHLLIFLLQMKTGISSALVKSLFSITLSDGSTRGIFSYLIYLFRESTQTFIMWPDKQAVIETLPDIFKENFSSCRLLLYCLHVPFEPLKSTSDYHDVLNIIGHSKKILIGFAPSGAVTFVSKVFPGNFSLLKVIIYSQVLNLLEPDDSAFLILDENHPYEKDWVLLSKRICVNRIDILFPPMNREHLTQNPIAEKILIWAHAINHIMRLKSHKILCSCSWESVQGLHDIVFMACVLANLQPL